MDVDVIKQRTQRVLRRAGIDLTKITQGDGLSDVDRDTVKFVQDYTMTSPERIAALCDAVRYVAANGIKGSIVECGVWRGGSMMAVARTLLEVDDTSRELYLYDTYAGMTEPTAHDEDAKGRTAAQGMKRFGRDDAGNSKWCNASLEDVTANIARTGYPLDRCHFLVGPVEETIPATMPESIALLRLDTDWYESTRHELEHLFPLLAPGGVLVLDDYGHWQGARQAVDEYFAQRGYHPLLNRIDYTGRIAVIPSGGAQLSAG
jgi:hypothetical protein